MTAGGPFEHRYVVEDDPEQVLICRICGWQHVPGTEEPGCPAHADLDELRAHPGQQLTTAKDAAAAMIELRRIWTEQGESA